VVGLVGFGKLKIESSKLNGEGRNARHTVPLGEINSGWMVQGSKGLEHRIANKFVLALAPKVIMKITIY